MGLPPGTEISPTLAWMWALVWFTQVPGYFLPCWSGRNSWRRFYSSSEAWTSPGMLDPLKSTHTGLFLTFIQSSGHLQPLPQEIRTV